MVQSPLKNVTACPQVRRKADSAKGLVREWLANWRDAPLVSASESHRQLTGAFSASK